MPIAQENKTRYPEYWDILSWWIKVRRAGNQCECRGECGQPHSLDREGRCPEIHGRNAIGFDGTVELTTAHLDHTPEHNDALAVDKSNLRAMCQACHLRYDVGYHQSYNNESQQNLFSSRHKKCS